MVPVSPRPRTVPVPSSAIASVFSTLAHQFRPRGAPCTMPVEVRYYTDPACIWSWGAEPRLRRLMWEFGDELDFRWIMGGLAREYGPGYRDEEGGIGLGADTFTDLVTHWL